MNVTNLGSFCLIFLYEKKNMRVKVFSQKNGQLFRHVEFLPDRRGCSMFVA